MSAPLLLLLWVSGPAAGDLLSAKPATRESFKRVPIPFPQDNPYSPAKAELGRLLFFDPLLSGSEVRSCGHCHNPGLSWGDGLPRAIGELQISVRSPTLIDIAWVPTLGWDGKFPSLEAVTFGPILGKGNMNLPTSEVLISRLSAIPGYVKAFNDSFNDKSITRNNIELALATYQRTIVAAESPFDRWVNGDESAIDAAAKRGFNLFTGKARCAECHSGPAFTDGSFHDIGTAQGEDIGRGRLFPTSVKLKYAFKTPTLRDVARRAPYMHDGSVATLEQVIALYDRGGIERPSRSSKIIPLGLNEKEKSDLLAFLSTLNGAPEPALVPVLPR
ncbi:MAG: cytochrome c peroxidase [Alphaproteobacteria bacterium]|nr:cytochrome c peroxidase [Alphaproteobacteria bacterium]